MKAMSRALSKGDLAAALAEELGLKKSVCSKTMSDSAMIATISVKAAGIFVIPGVCKTKIRQKLPTKARKNMMCGNEGVITVEPAETIVKGIFGGCFEKMHDPPAISKVILTWKKLNTCTFSGRCLDITIRDGAAVIFLKIEATAWAAGSNDYGQLGDGSRTIRFAPVQILSDVQSIAAGCGRTIFLKIDATTLTAGRNGFGQLGDGSTWNHFTPVQVLLDVRSVAAGGRHTILSRIDASAWATGRNGFGQLGDGSRTIRHTPSQVLWDVQSIAAGGHHTIFLKATIWIVASLHTNV